MESSLCFLKLFFWCAWPLQNFLDGRTVFIIKPVFRPCMCGCTFARIFIHSAWSNLCHIKINCLFVYLCSWPIFLDSALLHCCYLEVLALLLMFLLMHLECRYSLICHSHFLSDLISWFPTMSSNMLYVMVLWCDFRWYSFIWIYQHGWVHYSRSREGEHSCYGCSSKACINFIHIFVPFAS